MRVETLRVADQQKVEILRALVRDARLIVMDEPTAALTRDEADRLLEITRDLRADGVTVIYVSHILGDVLALCDTVTVLKDGRHVQTAPAAEETVDSLVTAMLGRSMDLVFPARVPPPADAPVVLSVRGLSRPPAFEDVSFEIRAGRDRRAGRTRRQRAHRDRPRRSSAPTPATGTVEVEGAPAAAGARRGAASGAGSRSCPRAARTRAS